MSDPVAEAVKKEEEQKAVEEKAAEEKTNENKSGNQDVVNALKEVKEALTTKNNPVPTRAEIRAALKEKTGFSDAQLDVVEQMQAASLNASNKKTAELQEKVTWNEFEKEIGGNIDPAVEKIMKEELKQYDVESRGDKVLLQKVYYMSLGIQADKIAKARKADPNASDKPNDNPKIEGRTIVETNKGSVQSLESGQKSNANGSQLTDDEKVVAAKMGVSEGDYAKAKTTKIVSRLKGAAA